MRTSAIRRVLWSVLLSIGVAGPLIAEVRVEDGIVQPRRPIGEAVEAAAEFLTKSDGDYVPGRMTDDATPGYLISALVAEDGGRVDPKIAYPARHHAYFIRTFLRLHGYTGDASWLARAKDLADWNITHCTDAESDWPYMPWSTYNNKTPGGGADHDAIEPDKSAFIGIAILEVYDATGEAKYLDMANRIADTLIRHQQHDGYWPFRPHPKHGYAYEWYGGAPVFYVEFFDHLMRYRQDKKLATARSHVFDYMMKTNIEKGLWGTYHEDVHPQRREYLSAEPICFTSLWLLRHGEEHPGYIGAAWKILQQIHGVLVHYTEMPVSPAPAVAEQPSCNFVMPGHTARYSSSLAELYRLTGNDNYRRDAISGFNGTTHMQTDLGLFRTWIYDPEAKRKASGTDWYSQHLYTIFHMLDTMPRLPELAPADENRLLGGNIVFSSVSYRDNQISYATTDKSEIVARVTAEPKSVVFDGKPLHRATRPTDKPSWQYDAETGVLKIQHAAGSITITLP